MTLICESFDQYANIYVGMFEIENCASTVIL